MRQKLKCTPHILAHPKKAAILLIAELNLTTHPGIFWITHFLPNCSLRSLKLNKYLRIHSI